MKNEIKETNRDINYWVKYWKSMQEKGCPNFDVYLQIYEDTSKAKDEEFINILFTYFERNKHLPMIDYYKILKQMEKKA